MSQVTADAADTIKNNDATRSARASDAPTWLVVLAKSGYAARGVIYLIIGSLALLKAFGEGGQSAGSKDAISKLLEAPGGQILLWLMALGLVGYSVWRFVQAVMDTDDHGTDGKGLAVRAGLLVSALTHVGLAIYAASIAIGSGSSSGSGGGKETLVAKIMAWPGGQWIVGLIGLCIIGAGIAHAVKAHKEKYEKRFVIEPSKMKKLEPICKFGLYARSVVFGIIGSMFIYAAISQDPDDAGGLKEVLDTLSQQAFGTILLAVIAAGLFAFGCYRGFQAIYRKIDSPD